MSWGQGARQGLNYLEQKVPPKVWRGCSSPLPPLFLFLFFLWLRIATKPGDCEVALMSAWVLTGVYFPLPTSILVSQGLGPAWIQSWIPGVFCPASHTVSSSLQVSMHWLLWESGCKIPRM